MKPKYNVGDKVKFYDNEFSEERVVTIISLDDAEEHPMHEVQESGEQFTWYLSEELIIDLAWFEQLTYP